jgi:hypothetical protein
MATWKAASARLRERSPERSARKRPRADSLVRRIPSGLAGYRCDYDDSFEASVVAANERTPEQWARAVFEDAPRSVRWFLLVGTHRPSGSTR